MTIFSRRDLVLALGATGAVSALAACAGPPPPPTQRFYLRSHEIPQARLEPGSWSLQVAPPQAPPALNTNRIAQSLTANQFDYYADAEWGDPAPIMMQTVMINSFEKTEALPAISSERGRGRPDFALQTVLTEFFGDGPVGAPATARVGLRAELVRYRGREVVGASRFDGVSTATAPGIDALVEAFDLAARATVADLVVWTLSTGNRAAA